MKKIVTICVGMVLFLQVLLGMAERPDFVQAQQPGLNDQALFAQLVAGRMKGGQAFCAARTTLESLFGILHRTQGAFTAAAANAREEHEVFVADCLEEIWHVLYLEPRACLPTELVKLVWDIYRTAELPLVSSTSLYLLAMLYRSSPQSFYFMDELLRLIQAQLSVEDASCADRCAQFNFLHICACKDVDKVLPIDWNFVKQRARAVLDDPSLKDYSLCMIAEKICGREEGVMPLWLERDALVIQKLCDDPAFRQQEFANQGLKPFLLRVASDLRGLLIGSGVLIDELRTTIENLLFVIYEWGRITQDWLWPFDALWLACLVLIRSRCSEPAKKCALALLEMFFNKGSYAKETVRVILTEAIAPLVLRSDAGGLPINLQDRLYLLLRSCNKVFQEKDSIIERAVAAIEEFKAADHGYKMGVSWGDDRTWGLRVEGIE